jgi:hypothetical protein
MFLFRYLAVHGTAKALLYAISITFVLGIGVEIVQFIDKVFVQRMAEECLGGWCFFYEDSLKDLVNDLLGSLLYAIPIFSSSRRAN